MTETCGVMCRFIDASSSIFIYHSSNGLVRELVTMSQLAKKYPTVSHYAKNLSDIVLKY